MRTALAWIMGLALAANGAAMLAAPAAWYSAVPGVTSTGPFNPHFVRDIGCAYFAAGAALLWFAAEPRARPAAALACAFLALHAGVHLWDWAVDRESLGQLLADLPTVFAPPALIAWLAGPRLHSSKEKHHAEMADAATDSRI